MALLDYAKSELHRISLDNGDEYNQMMYDHILHMVEEFSNEGHSGMSAGYAIAILTKLLDYKPLSPLTGEDDEWVFLDYGTDSRWQNIRCGKIFKDAEGNAYNIEGKVFWEWSKRPYAEDEPGYPGWTEPYKAYYTCRESRTPVTFPYTVSDKPIYEWRWSDADPQTPAQTEEGFI